MKIVISGGSGFIGSNLTSYFKEKGHQVVPLKRDYFEGIVPGDKLINALYNADIVINLAGESINHRWTRAYREKMYNSRINTTRKIVEVINMQKRKPELLISASAVGYYPTSGCYDEYTSRKGKGFLSDLCEAWEQEARKISDDVRMAITRFGVVLNNTGGALPMLRMPAKFKISTVIGPGNQLLPWIYLQDLMEAMDYIINNPSINGTVNLVSPQQITNRELITTLGKNEKSWLTIKIPKFFFQLALGEASDFITTGQCVKPAKLINSGFEFQASTINQLMNIIYKK